MGLYTERHGMRTPIKKTDSISIKAYSLLYDCCTRYFEHLAWKYPEECPDGNGCCGLDLEKFNSDMEFEIPTLFRKDGFIDKPRSIKNIFEDEPINDEFDQYALLDLIEFVAQNVRDITRRSYHSFFRHNDLSFGTTNAIAGKFVDEINDIFHRYHEFEMRLYEALYNGGLSALSNVALSFFKNPMQVHDEKFILLSRPQYVSGMTEVDYDEKTGISSFKLDLINTLKYDKDYIKTLSARGAHFWIKPYLTPYRVMYVNLFDRNNRYRGRVILNEINSIFHPSHFQMLEYFAEFVLRAVTATSRREKDKTYVSFEMLLKHCLKGSWPSREMALKAISLYNWQEEDTYLCVKILIPNNNREINSEDILVISLMLLFKQCKVFVDNNYIWLVENLSAEKMTLETFQKKMREFSKEGAYHCGQSAVFHDFFRMTQGFQQASMALKFSRKYQPDVLYTPFSDIVNRYLMSRIREDISVETICHEKLLFLQEYDAKKGTDHFHTLRVYLENERNLTLVSSLLHVHRSTLQYRIEKLEELTELPLDDAELRFYLLCCFRLLDEVREAGTAGPSSPR